MSILFLASALLTLWVTDNDIVRAVTAGVVTVAALTLLALFSWTAVRARRQR